MPLNRKERMAICEECPNFTRIKTCTECGCFMPIKVRLPMMKCPAGKW